MKKSIFKSLVDKLKLVQTKEQFLGVAKDWTASPVERDEFRSAIAFIDLPFGDRCQMYKWFDEAWRKQ